MRTNFVYAVQLSSYTYLKKERKEGEKEKEEEKQEEEEKQQQITDIFTGDFIDLDERKRKFRSTFSSRKWRVYVRKCIAVLCFRYREVAPIAEL